MPEIRQLSDDVINKIAAGEVIERPASVVKELLENALDAGATHIEIDLKEGGRKQIVIKDDGCGISPHYLKLALMRHATSKLRTADDLSHMTTLGFRGEALASIASVAKLTITSRSRETSDLAHEVSVEGGELIHEGQAGHPFGTTVQVRQLFYQTPARLKFLKSPETEVSHIVDHVTKIALAHPNVTLRLNHNDKKILSSQATTDLRQRVADLFDESVSRACYPILAPDSWLSQALQETGTPQIVVSGLVGHPEISRSHQRHLFLFVNGRAIRDKVIFHAVMEAYRNLLMHGRYPFVVLNISVPTEEVDVNVHPAKSEVRFSNSQAVHRMVQSTLRRTLETEPWKNLASSSAKSDNQIPDTNFTNRNFSDRKGISPQNYSGTHRSDKNPSWLNHQSQDLQRNLGEMIYGPKDHTIQDVSLHLTTSRQVHQNTVPFSGMRLLGQLWATYLVCEAEGKLILIDQHAAHERIGFEKLKQQWDSGQVETHDLLIPIHFDLKPSEAEILKNYLKDLRDFGLEIDFFGGQTFMVRAMPSLFSGKVSIDQLVHDFVGDILEKGQLTSLKDCVGDLLASMACHGAIRANHRLSHEEMQALLKELDAYAFTSYCPHGRPVAVDVGQMELERWFKRIV